MADYVITTETGHECLVSADSKDAEPATADQVARIGGTAHDYRGDD